MKPYYLLSLMLLFFSFCSAQKDLKHKVQETLYESIMENAQWAMDQPPQTITDFSCDRSAGGIHDFYSEGDYWWPNPENPTGAYIRRDGLTNPENFIAHRLAMIRFSKVVGYLASAYILTKDEKYVKKAFQHIDAWFVNAYTKMNPDLTYAQAIKGVVTGRGVGIIDTIHLMEVAQGILRMQDAACVNKKDIITIKSWFASYINWLMSHPYGIEEMNSQNNHATCWVMQVASFAKLTGNEEVQEFCRMRYKIILLPQQTAADGSFPRELARTKPYGYSLFNMDAMATICQILSTPTINLWKYTTAQGVGISKIIDYMFPFVKDKTLWRLPPDVMYWDEWPMAHPAFAFAAIAKKGAKYLDAWTDFKHQSDVAEVERNMPIRNPLLWIY